MRIIGYLLAPLFALSAVAHEGHDHAEALPPDATIAPRFAVASEEFELVGELHGRALILYLDQYASNAPVAKAELELETGGRKISAREGEAGVYHLDLPVVAPGRLALVFTVRAGESGDLLSAHLDIPPPAAPAVAALDWRRLGWLGWPLLGLAVWWLARRRKNRV